MLRKIGYSLLCAGALFSANTLAMTHALVSGSGIEYELAPNQPHEFTNPVFFSVTATCTFRSENPSNDVFVEALSKSGVINGQKITAPDTLTITINSGDVIKLTVNPGAKVRLTNRGESSIHASCSVGS